MVFYLKFIFPYTLSESTKNKPIFLFFIYRSIVHVSVNDIEERHQEGGITVFDNDIIRYMQFTGIVQSNGYVTNKLDMINEIETIDVKGG